MSIARGAVLGILLLGGMGLFAHTTFWLYRYVRQGRDQPMPIGLADRIRGFLVYVLGQSRVIRAPAGILHFFIFWGFLVLQLETLEYMIRGFYWPFHFSLLMGETLYGLMLMVQDIIGFAVLVAVIIAGFRRFLLRPPHTVVSTDAGVILALIGGLMVTKFVANGAEIALMPAAQLGHPANWTPFAYATSFLLGGPGGADYSLLARIAYHGGYWSHIGIVIFFLNYIPFGKHLHLLGAMPNVFFKKLGDERGALYAIDMEDETAEQFGAKEVEDLTWKQILDTYACTECARCEQYCPAYNTGKPLNPMMIVHNLKEHARDKGEHRLQKGHDNGALNGSGQHLTHAFDLGGEFPSLVGGVITKEELWACTTCGACVSNCPVFIEHVDTIVDMRRYLVLMESDVSPEVARTFRNIENNSNPWGISASYRADWAEGLDIPLLSDLNEQPDYLFFVGCAGSFDDRQKKVTQAFARLMKEADISFAILGGKERCTGDAPRRIGNEYLFQICARENIETFNAHKVTKIVTTCPHCFHTIGKEYPQLGGNYEVIHHSSLLADLLRQGAIQLRPGAGEKIVYHDSCYIGRWDNNYESPRDILDAIGNTQRVEMDLNRRGSFCCGAGGGQMWMEEDIGKRVNLERTDQALATEADMVAVACPFCLTMFDDGLKNRGAEQMELKDIAEILDYYMVPKPRDTDELPEASGSEAAAPAM